MRLQNIRLINYRNYELLELETPGNVNLIVGPNAQGKTNLLESIYVLALTKSHRTQKDKELIQWDKKQALIAAQIEKKYGNVSLELRLAPQGKTAKINGLEQRKLSDFIGALNVVMFAPEDLEIVKGSPGIRRRFLDMEIAQVIPSYLYHMQQYQKILLQRNNYLKEIQNSNQINEMMLEIWNQQLAEYGSKIMKSRENFIINLQKWALSIHESITKGKEQLQIEYRPSFEISDFSNESVLFDQFMIKLKQVQQQEIRRGMTLYGPHRDDLGFYINGKDVQMFGSQGQQRTVALSVKLAEIELIRKETGEFPLLLLDDVLSELDQNRQNQLIETFQNKVQTFITATGADNVSLSKFDHAGIFYVAEGNVTPKKLEE